MKSPGSTRVSTANGMMNRISEGNEDSSLLSRSIDRDRDRDRKYTTTADAGYASSSDDEDDFRG
jgi:hypothetical protein